MSKTQKEDLSKFFLSITALIMVPSAITSWLGLVHIIGRNEWWATTVAALIAIAGALCAAGLWKAQSDIFIRLDDIYRDRRMWAAHFLTPVFLTLINALPSYTYMSLFSANELHMNAGIEQARESLDRANAANRSLLDLGDIIRANASELAALGESAANGEVSGKAGKGVIYRRVKQGERQLLSIVEMIERSEQETNQLITSANNALKRMRRAIPSNGSPLEGLPEYEKAQRDFSDNYQKLSQKNIALQIKTALAGLENSIIAVANQDQKQSLDLIDNKLKEMAHSIITAAEDQQTTLDPLPEWHIEAPVRVTLMYINHLWSTAALTICLEISPLFFLWGIWALSRQESEDVLEETVFSLRQYEVLAEMMKRLTRLQTDFEQKNREDI